MLHQDKDFLKINYLDRTLVDQSFESCVFTNCDFSQCALESTDFIDCKFDNCNIGMAITEKTGFKNVTFKNCKLVGTDFSLCNDFLFEITCENCILDYASFFQKKIKNIVFNECSMKEVDFTEADLTGASFLNCDLIAARFDRSILEKADFRTAINFSINPELNRIKKARFSATGLAGLLHNYDLRVE